ncbi:galactitol-1-phosphate 5-dehydrogenase [Staphylococcus intermedius]|uniref:Putative zinc-binding dehydrogenase n=1 Tax=Staphylococcus intermedius NCTC 11048 TaxID=1141106 RepID=A0A380G4I9_STAIN|nr:galactitol-1-phosphate 5-dehydrogenase [Staphylococcus intermedius]PCF64020.1 galactitol-1-phosphate 5-dehydrogenase [Staphylococcus intermedius]PCF78735.1 galactitol-1-phosphate 5-dehydrogenase [Staphylococcus intermedius]PCF79708.1 galactitol-1-phosphate 5-dehydrogenase [Staphylococcus intermedius]PCF85942.1 galactitol-1-phosphate 5-dehydrogenase [Staphylococcus intermedius]PCF89633.1 galactitol-1-phosphate 5-dehydrogenase [Staphylococcus intermedius]
MKALNLYHMNDLRYEECEMPVIEADNDVVIEVKATGICGSDTSRYAKLGPYVKGMTFGHEFSGVVHQVGEGVSNVAVGDRVTACPTIVCGQCDYCKQGAYSRCENLYVIGSYVPGSFAQYVKVPASHVLKIPDNVDFQTAAMVEPSAVVAHGFYKTHLKPGMTVAVIGTGSIGLLAIQWAKIFGATQIIAIDIDDHKLEVAQKVGADIVINSAKVDLEETVQQMYRDKIDLAVESSGAKSVIGSVLTLPKKGGEVLFLGIPYADIALSRMQFEKILRNELSLFGSWNALSAVFPGKEWTSTLHYMSEGAIRVAPIVSHYVPLSQGPEMFSRIIQRKENINKVIFYPE